MDKNTHQVARRCLRQAGGRSCQLGKMICCVMSMPMPMVLMVSMGVVMVITVVPMFVVCTMVMTFTKVMI